MARGFDFDNPINRRNTGSLKWDRYKDTDIDPLWVADMDFLSPPAVIQALHERVEHGVFGYTLPPAELARVVCERMARLYDWCVEAEWIIWLPGLVTGLNLACRAIGSPGDAVATMTPIYPPFLSAPGSADRQVSAVPMIETDNRWHIDFDALKSALTPQVRLLLLCSPHNPTGRIFERCELEMLAGLCLANDTVICSDEIHCDLVLDPAGRHMPTASLSTEIEKQTITLLAPSKTYNIPGLGASFAIIPDAGLRAGFQKAMEGIVPWVNALGFTGALAAYQHGDGWLAAVIDYLRINRDLVTQAVNAMPGLKTNSPEATYLAWIDCREAGLDDPARFFEKAGVGLSNGADFGAPGFVRLNFACPRARLEGSLAKMKGVLVENH